MKKKLKLKFHKEFLAFPYTAVSIIFVIIPLILILVYAFTDTTGDFSFDNFERLGDITVWQTMGRSALVAFLTTLICLLLAYPTAVALTKLKASRRAIVLMAFVMPMWINSLLRIYAVKLLFGDIFGMERGFLLTLIGMVYDFFPFMLLPIYNILEDMDKGVLEASADLGANPVRSFLTVKLPLSVPGIVSGVLMVFMPTVSSFAIYDILGYDGGSAGFLDGKLFGNIVYTYFEKGYYNSGSALALILLVLILISTVVSNIVTKGKAGRTGGTIS